MKTILMMLAIVAVAILSTYGIKKLFDTNENKYLDIPEELPIVKSGDTVYLRVSGDTTYLTLQPDRDNYGNKLYIIK